MIWFPFPEIGKNVSVLSDDDIFGVVFAGMQCLRDIWSGQTGTHARMWWQHPAHLLFYVAAAEREMVGRGYDPEPRVHRAHVALSRDGRPLAPVPPAWVGDPGFHQAQCSHLIRINPTHYAQRLPFTTPLELPLLWPQ